MLLQTVRRGGCSITSKGIKIRTLTPLWTGDIEGKCTKIKETGIIGSLRWWYEALVRGLGGYACDPTSEERCPDKNGNRCDVCELFGCTGWQRRFNLRVADIPRNNINFLSRMEHPIFYHKADKRNLNFWYEKLYDDTPKAFYSEKKIDVEIYSNNIQLSDGDIKDVIGFLLRLLSIGGGIGAKNQIGFGMIEDESKNFDLKNGYELIESLKGTRENVKARTPTLNDYFKFEIEFSSDFLEGKSAMWYPSSPAQKDYLCTGFAMKFLVRNIIKKEDERAKNICKNYDKISKKSKERMKSLQYKGNYRNAKKYNTANKVIARSLLGSDLGDKKKAALIHISDVWRKNDVYRMRIWNRSYGSRSQTYDLLW